MRSFHVLGVATGLSACLMVIDVRAQEVEQTGPSGFLDPGRDKAAIDLLQQRPLPLLAPHQPQRPFFAEREVSHVANGIALRDRTRGFIHVRGVPQRSEVVRSFLLFNLSDGKREGAATAPVLIDGNLVVARKTADNSDPCWGKAGNHSYIADVTAFTNRSGGPNQEYEVTLAFTEGTSTSGLNPWGGNPTPETILEGASIIVVYRNDRTRGPLYLFTPKGDNMFVGNTTYLLPTPALGPGLFTMVGGDGQRGFGHDNALSNELTFFDGTQIAGPPVAASDWDGSDGLTLPQLWDTHTHRVRMGSTVAKIEYQSSSYDCLVPVGFVLDQE